MSIAAIYNLQIECKLRIDQILSFEVTAVKDCHACMQTTVFINDSMRKQIIDSFNGDTISAWITDENGNKTRCLFAGQIDGLHMEYEGDLEKVTISAVSSSILLDAEKKSRSFQDISNSYFGIISKVLDDTNGAHALLHTQDMLPGKPVIQYEETDWQFLKRMASHLKTSVTPDFRQAAPRVHVGLRNGVDIGPIECIKYKTGFDPRYYTDGKLLNMRKPSFIYYDVDAYALYNIGDIVTFLGQKLRICGLRYSLKKGIIYCIYRLSTPAYFKIKQHYNDNLRALSLQGIVLKTNHELLRIHLDIDDHQDPETAYDYTWRPETGNLMYSMPETGTRVSLYIQNADEFSAICKHCDRTNGAQFSEAQNPEDRYLTTAHGKRVFWKQSEAGFISLPVNTYVKIDDTIGAVIDSSGRLLMQADEEFTVDGKRVVFNAPKEVTVVRRKMEAPTVLNTCYNMDIIGNIGGFSTTKPPVKPNNPTSVFGEIEEFDMGEIADTIIAAIPAGNKSESTPISTALQGTFIAHMPEERRRG